MPKTALSHKESQEPIIMPKLRHHLITIGLFGYDFSWPDLFYNGNSYSIPCIIHTLKILYYISSV